jgi:ubiquinone/menaquinone biosynthesis C-methylase UbiE
LLSLCPCSDLAWDCACGSGQASTGLAECFKQVIATDLSFAQIKKAPVSKNIEYRVCSAECLDLDSQSVDRIVVAQALHWFNFHLFYKEASRVLKSDAILAVISYQFSRISTEIDDLIDQFKQNIVGDFGPLSEPT